jgi:hypothetical protein
MERTDVPMDGIHQVQRDLETLDIMLSTRPKGLGEEIADTQHSLYTSTRGGIARPEFIRTIVLGILAKLDAAIVEINES